MPAHTSEALLKGRRLPLVHRIEWLMEPRLRSTLTQSPTKGAAHGFGCGSLKNYGVILTDSAIFITPSFRALFLNCV